MPTETSSSASRADMPTVPFDIPIEAPHEHEVNTDQLPTVPIATIPDLRTVPVKTESTPELDERKLSIEVVDLSRGVQAEARESAENYISEQTSQSGIKGFLKKVWHGNLARDYILQKHQSEAKREIIQSGNLYTMSGHDKAEYQAAASHTVQRVQEGYLHSDEAREALAGIPSGADLEDGLKKLVIDFAQGNIGAEELHEEKVRLLNNFGEKLSSEDRRKGLLLADNVLTVAKHAREVFSSGVALDRIDQVLKGSLSQVHVGVRSTFEATGADKIVDKLAASRAGSLVNETTLAGAIGIAMAASKITTQKAATAAAATVTLGVGAGVVAGVREHHRVGREREFHLRQRAQNGEIQPGSKRREQMEETAYDSVSAVHLSENLEHALEAMDSLAAGPLKIEAIREVISKIADADTRIAMSDTKGLDLIHFSSKVSVERERFSLDVAIAKAKVLLQKRIGQLDESEKAQLGVTTDDSETLLAKTSEIIEAQLETDIDAKDRVFKKLRRNRTLKMAVIATATGLAVGAGIQELRAAADDSMRGLFESSSGDQDRKSLLAGLFGGGGTIHNQLNHTSTGQLLQKNSSIHLPEGYTIGENGQLLGPDDKLVLDHMGIQPDGKLDPETISALHEKGLNVTGASEEITHTKKVPVITERHITRTPADYVQKHPHEFTHVSRELWYDNNTPGVYDHNELRLTWGGNEGTGMDSKGNYVFSVAGMSSDGSWHGDQSANAQQLFKSGDMAIALSVSQDTQTHVIFVPIDHNGNAIIDPDSFAGKHLFQNSGGKAHFVGAFAEAAQIGETSDGKTSVRMLATVVGDNHPRTIQDTLIHKEFKTVDDSYIRQNIYLEAPNNLPVEPFAPLPIYSRKGLEPVVFPNTGYETPYLYAQSYTYNYTPEVRRERIFPFSPGLEDDPDFDVEANSTAKRYLEGLSLSDKRVIADLKKQLKTQPSSSSPKAVVIIPAAAHQEGKNIYKTLSNYLGQSLGKDNFEVVVFANNPAGEQRDNTIPMVQKFQREHPEISVRLIEHQVTGEQANLGWVRKISTDTVIEDLLERDVDLNTIMLVSNDADSEQIDPEYLATIMAKANDNPDVDAFLGFIDWSTDAYAAYPDIMAGTRFMQMLDVYARVSTKYVASSGANFAFRPSIYTAVGGYKSVSGAGEDVVLGSMIKTARMGAASRRPIAFLGREGSAVHTSARRALATLIRSGGAPATQWNEFGLNDSLRTDVFDMQRFNFNDPERVSQMVRSVEGMINQTLENYGFGDVTGSSGSYKPAVVDPDSTETIRNINRILWMLGVKASWGTEGLKILDAERMVRGLQNWQLRVS